MNTLQVHHVESFKFRTDTFDVRRRRTAKRHSKLRGA